MGKGLDKRLDEKWVWAAAAFLIGTLAAVAALERLRPRDDAPAAAGKPPAGGRIADTLPDPNSKPDPRVGPDPKVGPDRDSKPDSRAGADKKAGPSQ